MYVPQKGLVSFIRMKLETGVDPEDIKHTLVRAGFSEAHVDQAFRFVREKYPNSLQQIVQANDFLPTLSTKQKTLTQSVTQHKVNHIHVVQEQGHNEAQEARTHVENGFCSGKPVPEFYTIERPVPLHVRVQNQVHNHMEAVDSMASALKREADSHFKIHKGLFQGRLRRKDFTLGFIFFFAVGYVVLSLSAVVISIVSPTIWNSILELINHDTSGSLLMTVPVILAPITVMMLSLITRRLHNLELPGSLSWLFLVLFIPVDINRFYGMWFIYGALCLLFILLLAKKGDPKENQYGAFPDSKGSFFKRIFNV